MKNKKRILPTVLLLVSMLLLTSCQQQIGQIIPTPALLVETDGSTTALPTEIQPTTTPLPPTETPSPEPQPTAKEREFISGNLVRGLRITLAHPWSNEAADAFEAVVAEFNQTNELGIEVICRRAGGYEALSAALIDGTVRDHMVLTRGFDLAGVDDGTTWVNLSEAPGIEGVTQEPEPCSTCAKYLDETHKDRYITLLFQPALLYYNYSWARELGFEQPPFTMEDFRIQLKAAADALLKDVNYENNGAGGLLLSMTPQSALSWYRAFDGGFNSDDTYPVFAREQIEVTFGFLKDLRASGLSWQSQNPTPYQDFVNRNALVYEGTLDDLFPQEIAFQIAESDDEWLTLPYPTSGQGRSISMETLSLSISSTYDQAEAASAYFVRWMLQEASLGKLVEATGLWPIFSESPRESANDFYLAHPAWDSAYESNVTRLTLAPEAKNWGLSRLILQDANMRLYSLDAQFIPTILDTLDATLIEAGQTE